MLNKAIEMIQTKQITEYMTNLCLNTWQICVFSQNLFFKMETLKNFKPHYCKTRTIQFFTPYLKQSHHTAGFHWKIIVNLWGPVCHRKKGGFFSYGRFQKFEANCVNFMHSKYKHLFNLFLMLVYHNYFATLQWKKWINNIQNL